MGLHAVGRRRIGPIETRIGALDRATRLIETSNTHVALEGEGVGVLNVFVLEVVKIDLGEVSVNGDWVVGGQPVIVHAGTALLVWGWW